MFSYPPGPISKLRLVIGQTVSWILFHMSEKLLFHDESSFYANDRQVVRWAHSDEAAKPYAKGEGPSHMVTDLVSADYGWLWSPDGEEEAQVLFKAGKNHKGYFTAENILNQVAKAIDILEKYYPDEYHVLVYDNATTHQK